MSDNSQSTQQRISKIRGVLPVFQTPFNEDESIDFATLEKEIDWLYDQGVEGIVMAMASETPRLDSEERERLAESACKFGGERGVVVISVGAESGHIAERYARHAASVGADAVMAIPPVSAAILEDELKRYYERLIKAIDIPVIVQDASGYVGKPMSTALQANLFNDYPDRIMFKPEAPPLGQQLSALRDATDGVAPVFEGSGGISMVDSYRRGIVGTMPGADLIRGTAALWRALEAGDEGRIYKLAPIISSLIAPLTSLDAFVTVEKHLLMRQGIFKNMIVRSPVGYTLDQETRQEMDRLFDRLITAVEDE